MSEEEEMVEGGGGRPSTRWHRHHNRRRPNYTGRSSCCSPSLPVSLEEKLEQEEAEEDRAKRHGRSNRSRSTECADSARRSTTPAHTPLDAPIPTLLPPTAAHLR